MPFYKLTQEGYSVANTNVDGTFTEYTVGNEPAELKALMDIEAQAQLIAHYKSLYLGVVNDKLKELDYDSLATVQIWAGNTTFINGVDGKTYGDEATAILLWYQSIIAYNYGLLTTVAAENIPTDEEYLAGIPAYV